MGKLGIKIFSTVYQDKNGDYFYEKYGTFFPISAATSYISEAGKSAIKNGGKLYCLSGVECIIDNIVQTNKILSR